MNKRFLSLLVSLVASGAMLTLAGCGGSESDSIREANLDPPVSPSRPSGSDQKKPAARFADVPRLANKPAQAFEDNFGPAVKISAITDDPAMMPGEYRLYNVAGNPKGLSVRFYKGMAKRFNLLLGTPRRSSKEALFELFRIDVSKMKAVKGEPLSEKWAGESEGVTFKTAYAKRETVNGDFTMVHAEVER